MRHTALLQKFFYLFAFPLLLAAIWQLIAIISDKPNSFPRLEAIFSILAKPGEKVLITGSLLESTIVSLLRVGLGFLSAAAIAVPLGILMGHFRFVQQLLHSTVELLRPVPPLAWVPLILAWFGIRGIIDVFPQLSFSVVIHSIQFSTLIIIFIGSFFPVLLNTIQGVRAIPAEYLESARTMGSSGMNLLIKVLIPASLPTILTGIRIGLGVGWMCLVAAEMMPGSNSGLGYMIWYAYEMFRTDIVIAGIIVIGVIGLLLDSGIARLERKIASTIQK
ncbi:NitT/TauT family transport system permease protein [Desulfonatronum zhilinae]|nr:NitT/TauT family transport system permease protein [Desulfonatronum zhilinae]